MCEEVGIKFIGPSAKVMDLMGIRLMLKQMIKAGVPVIPGSDGEVYTAEEALEIATSCDVGKHLKEAVREFPEG